MPDYPEPSSCTSWLELVRQSLTIEEAAQIKGVPVEIAAGHIRKARVEWLREQDRKYGRDGLRGRRAA